MWACLHVVTQVLCDLLMRDQGMPACFKCKDLCLVLQAVQSRERKERLNSNSNGASSNGSQGKQSSDAESRGAKTAVTSQ